jgi:hypothetical protein
MIVRPKGLFGTREIWQMIRPAQSRKAAGS